DRDRTSFVVELRNPPHAVSDRCFWCSHCDGYSAIDLKERGVNRDRPVSTNACRLDSAVLSDDNPFRGWARRAMQAHNRAYIRAGEFQGYRHGSHRGRTRVLCDRALGIRRDQDRCSRFLCTWRCANPDVHQHPLDSCQFWIELDTRRPATGTRPRVVDFRRRLAELRIALHHSSPPDKRNRRKSHRDYDCKNTHRICGDGGSVFRLQCGASAGGRRQVWCQIADSGRLGWCGSRCLLCCRELAQYRGNASRYKRVHVAPECVTASCVAQGRRADQAEPSTVKPPLNSASRIVPPFSYVILVDQC